jgi:hypothetical protein
MVYLKPIGKHYNTAGMVMRGFAFKEMLAMGLLL